MVELAADEGGQGPGGQVDIAAAQTVAPGAFVVLAMHRHIDAGERQSSQPNLAKVVRLKWLRPAKIRSAGRTNQPPSERAVHSSKSRSKKSSSGLREISRKLRIMYVAILVPRLSEASRRPSGSPS